MDPTGNGNVTGRGPTKSSVQLPMPSDCEDCKISTHLGFWPNGWLGVIKRGPMLGV